MRDRLEELQKKSWEFQEAASEDAAPVPGEPEDDDSVVGVITQQAVVFEVEPVIDNFLSEAQKIREDITTLEIEVNQEEHFNLAYAYVVVFFHFIPKEKSDFYCHSINFFGSMSPTGAEVRPAAEDPGGHHASFQRDQERKQRNA